MKKIMFVLLLLASVSFAQFEELLNANYQASKDEDWNAYVATFDTSDMSPGAIEDMRTVVEAVWGGYDTDSFRVTDLSYVLDGNGYALLKYNLTLTVSDAKGSGSFTNNMEYVALCRQSGSKWKLLYSMPLADYLEFTDSINNATTTMVATEAYYNNATKKPVGDGLASMDGAAPAYSPDTEAAEKPLGTGTGGGTTPSKGCGSAFILAFAALGAFALGIHKE